MFSQLSAAGEGGGRAPGEDPSPGRHAQEPAAESPADDRAGDGENEEKSGKSRVGIPKTAPVHPNSSVAAPEFQDGDPGQGRGDPGAEGKGFLPGSGGGARNSVGWDLLEWVGLVWECRDCGRDPRGAMPRRDDASKPPWAAPSRNFEREKSP